MAGYVPTNPGWGAAATLAKKKAVPKTPAQTGAAAYQGATRPADEIMAWLAGASPDYGAVALPDYDAISSSANRQADATINPMLSANLTAQKALGEQRGLSQNASTNFNAALAGILTGGLEGQAGRDYAFKTFGGSYVGEIATVEGQKMFNDITRSFNDQEWQLLEKYDAIVAQRPDIYEQIYGDLVKGAEDNYERGIKLEDSSFEYKFKSALALLEQFRSDEKMALEEKKLAQKGTGSTAKPTVRNFSDGTTRQLNPKTGKWDVITSKSGAGPRVFQTSEGVFAIDEATGQVVWEKKTGKAKTTKTTTQIVEQPDGSKVLVNKANGKKIAVVAPPDPAEAAGSVSPSTLSNTVKRATSAGATALEKVTDAIWKKMPGSGAEQGTPEYAKAEAAYNAWLDSGKSFGTAMQRVIASISPHLKAIGYTSSQVRRAAYDIVSAEIDPPKGYKPPKARAARVAASNTVGGSQFANYTSPAPDDDIVYAQYKASKPMANDQLVQVLRQAGFEGRGLQVAYSIAKRESGGNPLAFNPNRSTGDRSWGLFQINTLGDMISRVRQFGLQSEMQLLDPLANAKAAYRMTDGGKNWYHWGVDTGFGAYRNAPVTMLPLPGTT